MKKMIAMLLVNILLLFIPINSFHETSIVHGEETAFFHFFAFNKAMLSDNLELQIRGVKAIKRISNAVSQINQSTVKTIIEPVLTLREYLKNPVEMKVSQKIILNQLNQYALKIQPEDTFMTYSHTHGVRNNFEKTEPWGGICLNNSTDLPHKGITVWPSYAEALLNIPAKNVIILTMSCYSGGFVEYLNEVKDQWANRVKEDRNFLVITSQNSKSQSGPVYINGELINPFTYAVEKALYGEADGYLNGEKDHSVTIGEFIGYITETTHSVCSTAYPQFVGSYKEEDILFKIKPTS